MGVFFFMRIRKVDLRACLDKASDIVNIYEGMFIGGKSTPRSVDQLVQLVEVHEQKKVEIRLLDLDANKEAVRGMYVAYDDRYEVVVLSGQNYCWQRFVLCKELFHVILDADEYRSVHVGELVDEFTNTFPLQEPGHESRPGAHVTNELVAEICAMEFLFPYADRVRIVSGDYDSSELAERYRVPRVFIEKYLSMDYLANLKEFHIKAAAAA